MTAPQDSAPSMSLCWHEGVNKIYDRLFSTTDLEGRLKIICDGVVSVFGADFCRIWMIKQGDRCGDNCPHATSNDPRHLCRYRDRCLHLVASSGRYTHLDGFHGRVPYDCYKIGRIASGKEATFLTNEVTSDPRVHNHQWAARLGLVAFAGYQLRDNNGRVNGVLAFFADHRITAEQHAIVENLANSTAQVIQVSLHQEELEEKVRQRTAELLVTNSELRREIARKKQVQQALVASEHRFRSLVRDLPNIAVQGFDRSKTVVFWNRASEKLFGFRPEESLGRKIDSLILFDSRRPLFRKDLEAWIRQERTMPSGETVLRDKKGFPVPVYASYVALTNSQGEKEFYSIHIDLTEIKKAREASRKSELRYRELFDHMKSGVAVLRAVEEGQDFVFLDFNRAAEQIEGISREQILGRRMSRMFPETVSSGLLEIVRQVWKDGEPRYHPVVVSRNDTILSWRENSVYKLPSGEVVVLYDDLTREKRMESEKEAMARKLRRSRKMEAIGLMAGGVAHDLNNILSGIVSYPELLLRQIPENSSLQRPLEVINESGLRAAAIVADLLTVARGAASRKEPASLNSLITRYLQSAEHSQCMKANPGVVFATRLRPEIPPIRCSPVHIRKILMNLAYNGAEAIDGPGRVEIATDTGRLDQSSQTRNPLPAGEYAILTVRDTGPGMSAQDVERIFEPFYTTKTGGRSGTGLGLTIVWNAVQDHGGHIDVATGPDGTQFTIYFPVTDELPEKPRSTVDLDLLTGNGETILIVDDEPTQREIACHMLEHLGYRPVAVACGEEAVAHIRNHRVDLVLLDMIMEPGLSGRETYERIIEIRKDQRAIIATGFATSSEVEKVFEAGAAMLVKKPYTLEQLGQAIREELGRAD
ncbi:hybrid sensor histidine kinase/response regulator [Desulfolithobacter dissulfuricans]|nr:PAS domain S-box protein [Desulfolithobacter dissulfuricans]